MGVTETFFECCWALPPCVRAADRAGQGRALLQGEPEQGKPPRARMLEGEARFSQRMGLQAFFWQRTPGKG